MSNGIGSLKKDEEEKLDPSSQRKDRQIKWMLGTPKGATEFKRFVEETHFFKDISRQF